VQPFAPPFYRRWLVDIDMDGNAIYGQVRPILTVTADVTLGTDVELIMVDGTGGAFTITLPPAADGNRLYRFKRTDAGVSEVTIDADGAETIDGVASQTLASQYDTLTIVSNSGAWWIV
jgi:hypothetical protein